MTGRGSVARLARPSGPGPRHVRAGSCPKPRSDVPDRLFGAGSRGEHGAQDALAKVKPGLPLRNRDLVSDLRQPPPCGEAGTPSFDIAALADDDDAPRRRNSRPEHQDGT